jgi:hypothetical protein
MSSEAELIVNIWETIRENLNNSKRAEIARELLYHFAEYGFEASDVESICDGDTDLEEAYKEVFESEDDDEDDDIYED